MHITDDVWTEVQDKFRDLVLNAMDDAMESALRSFSLPIRTHVAIGSRDADLPELFKALDRQFGHNMALQGHSRETFEELMDKAAQRWNSQ